LKIWRLNSHLDCVYSSGNIKDKDKAEKMPVMADKERNASAE